MAKAEPLIGSTFEFEQYKCRKCGKAFFIQTKDDIEFKKKKMMWEPTSPCCRPYKPNYKGVITNKEGLVEPTGMHIRQIKLTVAEIPYEINLVHKRRTAAESGKKAYPDP